MTMGIEAEGCRILLRRVRVTCRYRGRGQVRSAHQTMVGEASAGDTKVLSYPLGIHVVVPYGFAQETLGVEIAQAQDERPQALVVERLVAIDHATGQLTLVAWEAAWEGELGLWKENVLTALAGLGSRDSPERSPGESSRHPRGHAEGGLAQERPAVPGDDR